MIQLIGRTIKRTVKQTVQKFNFTFAKKFTAASVALSLLYTSAAVPVLQANLWEQRKTARNQNAQESQRRDSYTQLASAAGYLQEGFSSSIDNLLPESSKPSLSIPMKDHAGPSGAMSRAAVNSGSLPAPLLAVPYSYGEVFKVHVAKNLSAPFVLLIQDAHQIESAQRNVAQTLSHLQAKLGRRLLVGLEGSTGAFDIKQYRQLKNPKIQKEIWEVLIQKSLINGAEYFGLMAEKEPLLWGVEDEALYLNNVAAYRKGLEAREQTAEMINALETELAAIKIKLLTPELARLDSLGAKFGRHEIGLADYIQFFEGSPELNSGRYPEIDKYLSLARVEKDLDFKSIETQRNELIKILSKKLQPAELNQLLQMSVSYRLGRIGYAEYYRSLQAMLQNAKIDLKQYKGFNAYVQYVLMSERIDFGSLISNLEGIENAAVRRLAQTAEQKNAVEYSAQLRLAAKLTRQELSPEDWDSYRVRRNEIARLPENVALLSDIVKTREKSVAALALQQPMKNAGRALKLARSDVSAPSAAFADLLAVHEAFYSASHDRNVALTENFSAKLKESSSQFGVLIAGGFHTPGLQKEFESRGMSYALFRPRIGKVSGAGTDYLHVFAPDRTPIEKMLLGERLFLMPPSATATRSYPGMVNASALLKGAAVPLQAALGAEAGDAATGEANASKIAGAEVKVTASGNGIYEVSIDGQGDRTVFLGNEVPAELADAAPLTFRANTRDHSVILILPQKIIRQMSNFSMRMKVAGVVAPAVLLVSFSYLVHWPLIGGVDAGLLSLSAIAAASGVAVWVLRVVTIRNAIAHVSRSITIASQEKAMSAMLGFIAVFGPLLTMASSGSPQVAPVAWDQTQPGGAVFAVQPSLQSVQSQDFEAQVHATFRGMLSLTDPETGLLLHKGRINSENQIELLNQEEYAMTTPTDIAYQMTSLIIARDHGLLSSKEAEEKISRIVSNLEKMETVTFRYSPLRSWYFDWYDTRQLKDGIPQTAVNRKVSLIDNAILDLSLRAVESAFAGTPLAERINELQRRDYDHFYHFDSDHSKERLYGEYDAVTDRFSSNLSRWMDTEGTLSAIAARLDHTRDNVWDQLDRTLIGYELQDGTLLPIFKTKGGSIAEHLISGLWLDYKTIAPDAMAKNNQAVVDAHIDHAARNNSQLMFWSPAINPHTNIQSDYGLPALGDNKNGFPTGDGEGMVVAPYSVMLAHMYAPVQAEAVLNYMRTLNPEVFNDQFGWRASIAGDGTVAKDISGEHQGILLMALDAASKKQSGLPSTISMYLLKDIGPETDWGVEYVFGDTTHQYARSVAYFKKDNQDGSLSAGKLASVVDILNEFTQVTEFTTPKGSVERGLIKDSKKGDVTRIEVKTERFSRGKYNGVTYEPVSGPVDIRNAGADHLLIEAKTEGPVAYSVASQYSIEVIIELEGMTEMGVRKQTELLVWNTEWEKYSIRIDPRFNAITKIVVKFEGSPVLINQMAIAEQKEAGSGLNYGRLALIAAALITAHALARKILGRSGSSSNKDSGLPVSVPVTLNEAERKDIRFGTAGWRAKFPSEKNPDGTFTPDRIAVLMQSAADRVNANTQAYRKAGMVDWRGRPRVVIGYDHRNQGKHPETGVELSEQAYAEDSARIFAGNDIHVDLLNKPASTPLNLYAMKPHNAAGGLFLTPMRFLARYFVFLNAILPAQAAIMINFTASHNPATDGGVEIFDGLTGGLADDPVTKPIVERVWNGEIQNIWKAPAEHSLIRRIDPPIKQYAEYLKKVIGVDPDVIRNSGLRAAYDTQNGVAGPIIQALLLDMGLSESISVRNAESDPEFGGRKNSEITVDNLRETMEWMRKEGLDAVVTGDGDFDRSGLMTPKKDGLIRLYTGNDLASVQVFGFLKDEKARLGNRFNPARYAVVRSIVSTSWVDGIMQSFGVPLKNVLLTAVGFRFLNSKINGAKNEGKRVIVSFEENGGIAVGSALPYKDGIASTLYTLTIAAREKAAGRSMEDLYIEASQAAPRPDYGRYDVEGVGVDGSLQGAYGRVMSKFEETRKSFQVAIDRGERPKLGDTGLVVVETLTVDGPYFKLADSAGKVVGSVDVRASGTEPLWRIYVETIEDVPESARLNQEVYKWGRDIIFAEIGGAKNAHVKTVGNARVSEELPEEFSTVASDERPASDGASGTYSGLKRNLQAAGQEYLDILTESDPLPTSPDAFLVLGHSDLRAFLAFAQTWKEKYGPSQDRPGVPIVIAGGRGSGTAGLIQNILSHYRGQGKLSQSDIQFFEKAQNDETITESSLLMRVFAIEKIPADLIHREAEPSRNMAQNFTNSHETIRNLMSERGVAKPVIGIVSTPPMLKRAKATAAKAWHDDIAAGWSVKRVRAYDVTTSGLPDEDLLRTVGQTIGAPEYKISELEGTQSENNPSVESAEVSAAQWAALAQAREAHREFNRVLEGVKSVPASGQSVAAPADLDPAETGSIDMSDAQRSRWDRFKLSANGLFAGLLVRIPGKNPLTDKSSIAAANRVDHDVPAMTPDNLVAAQSRSIPDILAALPKEDLALVADFSGGISNDQYDSIQSRPSNMPRGEFAVKPVEDAIVRRLEGQEVDIVLAAGIASRLAALTNGGPLYAFRFANVMDGPIEDFKDPEIHEFLRNLRVTNPEFGDLTDTDMPYGARIMIARRFELARLVNRVNERLGEPRYNFADVLDRQKIIFHVNEESGPDIISDLARNHFYGFNPANIVFMIQDVHNTWIFDAETGQVVRPDESHIRPFGHGNLPYDEATPGIAFRMTLDQDSAQPVYRQEFIEQDALSYMMGQGAQTYAVEELADLNMLVHPLKLDQSVAAEVLFNEGHNMIGRAADNVTQQKGGFVLQRKDNGQHVIIEGPEIADPAYDGLLSADSVPRLNFWGFRGLIQPFRNAIQASGSPFFNLDVRPNDAGEARLALDTYWSNVTMLPGIDYHSVYFPGEGGNTFKTPARVPALVETYRYFNQSYSEAYPGQNTSAAGWTRWRSPSSDGGAGLRSLLPLVIFALPFAAIAAAIAARLIGTDSSASADFGSPDIMVAGFVSAVSANPLTKTLQRAWNRLTGGLSKASPVALSLSDLPQVAPILSGLAGDADPAVARSGRVLTNLGLLSAGTRRARGAEERLTPAELRRAVGRVVYGNAALSTPEDFEDTQRALEDARAARALELLLAERQDQNRDASRSGSLNYAERLAFTAASFERGQRGAAARAAAIILDGFDKERLAQNRERLTEEWKRHFLSVVTDAQRLASEHIVGDVDAAYQIVDGRGAVIRSEGFLETAGLEIGNASSGRSTWLIVDVATPERALAELKMIVSDQIAAQTRSGALSPGLQALQIELNKAPSERRVQLVHASELRRKQAVGGVPLLDASGVIHVREFLEAALGTLNQRFDPSRGVQLVTYNPHMLDVSGLNSQQVWFVLWYSLSAVFKINASSDILNSIKQSRIVETQA